MSKQALSEKMDLYRNHPLISGISVGRVKNGFIAIITSDEPLPDDLKTEIDRATYPYFVRFRSSPHKQSSK